MLIGFIHSAFQVFLPALSFNQHKEASVALTTPGEMTDSFDTELDLLSMPGEAVEYHGLQLIRDEFLMNVQKFASNIQRTVQQLEGELPLLSSSVKQDEFTWTSQVKSPQAFLF